MKTKPNSTSPMQRAVTIAAATVATLVGLPVNAATTSFPQYPLMTGGSTIPPNILLILDDSGSMNFIAMPKDVEIGSSYQGVQNGLNDDPVDRSYIHNTLYYNPTKTYRPWRTASTDLNDRLSNAVRAAPRPRAAGAVTCAATRTAFSTIRRSPTRGHRQATMIVTGSAHRARWWWLGRRCPPQGFRKAP